MLQSSAIHRSVTFVLPLLLIGGILSPVPAQGAEPSAPAASTSSIFVSPPVAPYRMNQDLRTLPRAAPGSGEFRQRLGGRAPVAPHAPHAPDPLRQSTQQGAIGLTVTPTEFAVANPNFDGFITGGSPPDTNGAPGPNHYIQTVNGSVFRIYDKTGTLLVGTTDFQSLWTAAGRRRTMIVACAAAAIRMSSTTTSPTGGY